MENSNSYTNIIQHLLNSSQLPVSFEGNPIIYTAALFCTMLATLISMTQIYSYVKEMIGIPDKMNAPINIYRWQIILMYLTVIVGAGPDAAYLWTYGEVSAKATARILTVDRIFDSLVLIPFLAFTWLQIRCAGVLKFQLLRKPIPVDILPTRKTVLFYSLCASLLLLMSVVVTFSK